MDYLVSKYGLKSIQENVSLFADVNHFQARDVAYLLLEIEKRYEIPVEQLVENLENINSCYSLSDIANVVQRMKSSIDIQGNEP